MDRINEHAFPVLETHIEFNDELNEYEPIEHLSGGLSKLELACIELRIPKTGDERLDALIREAERRDVAKAALEGVMGMALSPEDAGRLVGIARDKLVNPEDLITRSAVQIADALLSALKESQPKEGA